METDFRAGSGPPQWQNGFFFTGTILFINIHHYFIDNVIWKSRDPVTKQYLLT
jgi:hypothetical protein